MIFLCTQETKQQVYNLMYLDNVQKEKINFLIQKKTYFYDCCISFNVTCMYISLKCYSAVPSIPMLNKVKHLFYLNNLQENINTKGAFGNFNVYTRV